MQIHELPAHSGTPANESDFAIDTGTNTFKITFASLAEGIITTATAMINGVSQTVKAAIEALTGRVTTLENNKINKTGDETLKLSGSVPRVSVVATNVAGRFVASNTSNLLGIWDETKNNWVINRNTDGVTRLPGYWTQSTSGSTSTNYHKVIKNPDGLMIIIMRCTVNVAISSASGGIYYGTASLPDFPEVFDDVPVVTYSTITGSGTGNAWVWGRSAPTATNPGGVYLGRGGSTAANNYIITVHAIGRAAS